MKKLLWLAFVSAVGCGGGGKSTCEEAAAHMESCGLTNVTDNGACEDLHACYAKCIERASCDDVGVCYGNGGDVFDQPAGTCANTDLENCWLACG